MQDTAAPADTVQESNVAAIPFTHRPRPAIADATGPHAWQRRYGEGRWAAIEGVKTAEPLGGDRESTVSLFRDGRGDVAQLRVAFGRARGSHGDIAFTLDAAGLRELARCLIDAAHDIDANPARASCTGIVIGGAWRRPMPQISQDGERLQAALLERRTAALRPWFMRLIGRVWSW